MQGGKVWNDLPLVLKNTTTFAKLQEEFEDLALPEVLWGLTGRCILASKGARLRIKAHG